MVGSGADDIQKQTGGWSLTWQGNENVLERDFPGATTVLSATRQLLGDDRVVTDIDRAGPDTVALVVIGEDPYAEMLGDIGKTKTLEYSELKRSYRKDLQLIRELRARGHRVVTVFYSGRPLYVNEELMLSDAFVAAWLPGTEATGITDLCSATGRTTLPAGCRTRGQPTSATIRSTVSRHTWPTSRSPGLSRPGQTVTDRCSHWVTGCRSTRTGRTGSGSTRIRSL